MNEVKRDIQDRISKIDQTFKGFWWLWNSKVLLAEDRKALDSILIKMKNYYLSN